MTRGKAIEEVKNYENYPNGLSKECRDYIIKALEQEPTTKNDLGVDAVSRKDVLKLIYDYKENHSENREEYPINYGTLIDMIRWVRNLPPVTPQEPKTGKWCTDCREYDQEKHCCHRWSKVIRDTVEEMKQEYIEREVLDKIRAEIIELRSKQNVGVLECLDILDRYKAETENT